MLLYCDTIPLIIYVHVTLTQFDDDSTPLTTACGHGYTRTAETLLYHGALIDYQDKVW